MTAKILKNIYLDGNVELTVKDVLINIAQLTDTTKLKHQLDACETINISGFSDKSCKYRSSCKGISIKILYNLVYRLLMSLGNYAIYAEAATFYSQQK